MHSHRNFGGNQRWRSRHYTPADDQDVLDILDEHRDGRIRAVGGRHSWSAIGVDSNVTLDMRKMRAVQVVPQDGKAVARVGAGCRLQRLLDELHRKGDYTLPTIGVIKRQTIAGAISTGTHGSGRPSLSHYVVGVRLAAYDPASGAAKVFEYHGGDALRAARCALGCAGILLSVDLATVQKYRVAESVRRETSLDAVLPLYDAFPLTQFALAPYVWEYVVFQRAPVVLQPQSAGQWLKARLLRVWNRVWVDVLFHLLVKASIFVGDWAMKALQRAVPTLVSKVRRVDDAEHVLTMAHDCFRHEEMEVFVPASSLAEALAVIRYATEVFADEETAAPAEVAAALDAHGLHASLLRSRGLHTHHYPFSIRRLPQEDTTFISMGASAPEPLYAISVFTYNGPNRRQGYYAFCGWLARALYTLYKARLHWGKHFPLGVEEMARLYPQLETFNAFCRKFDPAGVFCNRYTEEVLGLRARRS